MSVPDCYGDYPVYDGQKLAERDCVTCKSIVGCTARIYPVQGEPVELGEIVPRELPQGHKDDGEKPRLDLLDAYAIEELSWVLTWGARKYAPHNWRKGIAISRLIGALLRHTFAFMRGEDNDPETGRSHMAHAMCCCMFLIWTMKFKPEYDDRKAGQREQG